MYSLTCYQHVFVKGTLLVIHLVLQRDEQNIHCIHLQIMITACLPLAMEKIKNTHFDIVLLKM